MKRLSRLKNRVAVITGAAQGIGEKIAAGMAREGAKVALADIREGADVAGNITENGGEACYIHCDVTDEDSCNAMAETVNARFGKIDILIANAALFNELKLQSFLEISVSEWERVMAVNTKGVWLSVKAVVPYMGAGASIINISTNRILTGVPGMLHYDASKGAVSAMTRVMAMELGDRKIRVNAIAPGLTMTENTARREGIEDRSRSVVSATALKQSQLPEDLVGTAIFLASEDSSRITGQTIVVDGGSVMR